MKRLVEEFGAWGRWFEDGMEDMLCQPWMTLTIMRVLACLVKQAKVSGQCTRTQRKIQERTGIGQSHISEAIQQLKHHDVLYQERRGGPVFLSLPYFYRGAEREIGHWQNEEAARRARGTTRNGQAQKNTRNRVPTSMAQP